MATIIAISSRPANYGNLLTEKSCHLLSISTNGNPLTGKSRRHDYAYQAVKRLKTEIRVNSIKSVYSAFYLLMLKRSTTPPGTTHRKLRESPDEDAPVIDLPLLQTEIP